MPTAASAEADSVIVDDESLFCDTAGPWSITFPAG